MNTTQKRKTQITIPKAFIYVICALFMFMVMLVIESDKTQTILTVGGNNVRFIYK